MQVAITEEIVRSSCRPESEKDELHSSHTCGSLTHLTGEGVTNREAGTTSRFIHAITAATRPSPLPHLQNDLRFDLR